MLIEAISDKGNKVPFNVKQIVAIDGVPYVSSNQELRDAVIDLNARMGMLERILGVSQVEFIQPTETAQQ